MVSPLRDEPGNGADTAMRTPRTLRLGAAELSRYPGLLFKVLLQALSANQEEVVLKLLPYYRQQPDADARLIQWGEAMMARRQRRYDESIRMYRDTLAREPQNLPVRMQLATTLFLNHEDEAALDQFERIRAMNLPASATHAVNRYIEAVHQRDQWDISGGLSYIRDDNVNNAPRPDTTLYGFRAWEPESASGAQYRIQLGRRLPLRNQYYNRVDIETGGKQYFSNRQYSESNATVSWSLGGQTGNRDIRLGPMYEKKWYAGGRATSDSLKQYSAFTGLALQASYWFNSHWQWRTQLQWGRERFNRQSYLDGTTLLWSNTAFYLSSAARFWNAGVDYYRKGARDKAHAFHLWNARAGWGQDWPLGISTYLQISYSQRKYEGYRLFLAQRQKNKETVAQLSVWHRGLHFLGFTPRLTFSYQSVRSNHAFYQFDKSRVFVDVSRRF
ncbi:TPR domain-containing protein [Advenella mimigardefordensis DPN7]|uniref:TPR domain-containing protein n=2 Tax=Advenella mimigardefordensis TaxID=302406 RepID=W0PHP9_ADVMD|nr:TPR domain-containing protein [Advenella mimigardefordensis DPN7]